MINFQPHHLAVLFDLCAVRSQFFSQLQVWNAVEVLKHALDGSELRDQVCGGLLSDSLDSGYIVDAVAGESQNFAYALRRHTPFDWSLPQLLGERADLLAF